MRISDWSSDVCSSDLRQVGLVPAGPELRRGVPGSLRDNPVLLGDVARRWRQQHDSGRLCRGCSDSCGRRGDHVAVLAEAADRAVLLLEFIARSEEHTSELQSLMRISYAVFCLKKKKKQLNITSTINNNK